MPLYIIIYLVFNKYCANKLDIIKLLDKIIEFSSKINII